MDIVLPIVVDDLERYLRLQRPSFEHCYSDLATTWLITRPSDVAQVRASTADLSGIRVVDERRLVPELRALPLLRRSSGRRDWHMQQVIKLAAAYKVDTDFCLVVDADIVAVKEFGDDDLVKDGRGLRPRRHVHTLRNWEENAGTALQMEPLDYTAAVSPSVLSREAVRSLAGYVRTLPPRAARAQQLFRIPGARHLLSWRAHLLASMPWTEYQLYETYLVRTDTFARFHFSSGDPVLYGNCIWEREDLDSWRPAKNGDPEHYMSIVQGWLDIPIEDLEDRLNEAGLLDRTGR